VVSRAMECNIMDEKSNVVLVLFVEIPLLLLLVSKLPLKEPHEDSK
jgi:hypothetical protein